MSDVDSEDTLSDGEEPLPLSPSKRLSNLEIKEKTNSAISALEISQLKEKADELEKQVQKWTSDREKLQAQVNKRKDSNMTSEALQENRNAEEKLQIVLALIVKLVGKEDMIRLMVDDDDKKILSAIKRRALRKPTSST